MRKISIVAAALVAAVGSTASASVILSYGFTDLNGSFDSATGMFSAVADDRSAGDVTRLAAPSGTANFDDGAFSTSAFAAVSINISVPGGSGSFVITDDNGDQLVGDIVGTWINGALGVYFNGDLSSVDFVDVSGDGTFDGTDGGSFDTDLPGTAPYIGAFIQLFVKTGNMGFFARDFTGISVQSSGEIIPGAGSLALLGFAGLSAGVRRRRN